MIRSALGTRSADKQLSAVLTTEDSVRYGVGAGGDALDTLLSKFLKKLSLCLSSPQVLASSLSLAFHRSPALQSLRGFKPEFWRGRRHRPPVMDSS